MKTKEFAQTGVTIPVIGMGTWNIAPPDTYAPNFIDEPAIVEALRFGIEKGLTHIDTAEMYGNGQAEQLIGRAISGFERSKLFIASKVEPEHYDYKGVFKAVEGSLQRLGTGYLDLYQLHWPSNDVPIVETMQAMDELADNGTIRFIGISNFSAQQVEQAQKTLSRHRIASNQVKYNAVSRGIEKDLLPYAIKEKITIIAYSPFDIGGIFHYAGKGRSVIERLAEKYQKTPAQVYLNWIIQKQPVITIPKAVQIQHLEENAAASDWHMEDEDYDAIDNAF